MIGAGSVLSTISNEDVLEFKIPVDELDIAKINYDKEVRVTIDAIDSTKENPIIGKITKLPLEGVSTAGVTEYYVSIQIPGSEDIKISMSANAEIITNSSKDVLMIPVNAVSKENGDTFVTVLMDDGITTKDRSIVTGERNISYVEGLDEGEMVIIPEASNSLF